MLVSSSYSSKNVKLTEQYERENAEMEFQQMRLGVPGLVVWQYSQQFLVQALAAGGDFGDAHVEDLLKLLSDRVPMMQRQTADSGEDPRCNLRATILMASHGNKSRFGCSG